MLLALLTYVADARVLSPDQSESDIVSHIETSCQLMTQTLGLSLWSDCRFKLDS